MSTTTLVVDNVLYTAVERVVQSDPPATLTRSDLDGSNSVLLHSWTQVSPRYLTAFGHKVLFAAGQNETAFGSEPWVTDGTVNGTRLLGDLYPGNSGSLPHDFRVTDDQKHALFLAKSIEHPSDQLYVTDGVTVKMIGPKPPIGYSGIDDIVYSPNGVAFSEELGGTQYSQRYVYDFAANTSDSYTLPSNRIINLGPTYAAAGTAYHFSTDSGGRIIGSFAGLTVNYRPTDVDAIQISDRDYYATTSAASRQESITIDPSIKLPLTFVSKAGSDTVAGGNGVYTIDLRQRSSHDGVANINARDGVITFASGDKITLSNGLFHILQSSGDTTDLNLNNSRPSYTVGDGVLHVYGTASNDQFKLTGVANTIRMQLDGQISRINSGGLNTVIIEAGDGDDVILLQNLALKSKIYGGAGHDEITGSIGKDRIYGGDGDDIIHGGDNHDTLYGQAGNDSLFGDGGHDYLVGGVGTDTLRGGASVDHLIYANGDDIHGNAGDKLTIDSIVG